MKILLVGMSANLGGIETFLFNLVRNNESSSVTFDFLYPYKNRMALEDEISDLGCKVYKLTPRKQNRRKHIAEIKQVYANDYDIIHCNIMDYSWFEPIVLAKKTNAKLIIHSHGSRLLSKSVKRKLLNFLGKIEFDNIVCERIACGQNAGKFMFSNRDFTVLNNGIDIEKFQYNAQCRKEIRDEVGIKKDTIVFGLIASFTPVKNHTFLVNVFSEYIKYNENSKLFLVGEGAQIDRIKKQVDELDLNDKIIFLGKRLDVYKIYSAIDIYVMPSLSEGFGLSLCEAQANGLKCYASENVDKSSDITGNVEFLSLKKSPEEWAKYIFNQNNMRDVKVLDKIPKEFDSRNSYKKIYEFYEECV